MRFFPTALRGAALLAALVAVAPQSAYVTSAVFESNHDTLADFYLNGNLLGATRYRNRWGVKVLSTSDNTLPMGYFKNNETNLFAVSNRDEGQWRSGQLGICYRLTVYHSDGDPVVVWSTPEQAKLLHLSQKDPDPKGWKELNFDDSGWVVPHAVWGFTRQYGAWVRLKDDAFDKGFVPHLSHNAHTFCQPYDKNLIRSKFSFPNRHATVKVTHNPPEAARGQAVTFRLEPGPDIAGMESFNLLAWIPKGMEILAAGKHARYDKASRRLSWKYSSRDTRVDEMELGVAKVIKATGWNSPHVVLGGDKVKLPYDQGAQISHSFDGWFKLEQPKLRPKDRQSKIVGVIIYSQIMVGGSYNKTTNEVDQVLVNYSVDGGKTAVLKKGSDVARTVWPGFDDGGWVNGYLDVTADREWTWQDVSNLAVSVRSRATGTRDVNRLASIIAVVRYAAISEVAPTFSTRITSAECGTLPVQAAVFQVGERTVAADVAEYPVNSHACAPTPVPTLTPTPVPLVAMKAPTPVPQGKTMAPTANFGLGCPTVAPEPFDIGGTFVNYCLKRSADITLVVYSGKDGKAVRRIENGKVRAGPNHQIFFNARDEEGKRLPYGDYIFELVASGKGGSMSSNTSADFVKAKKRRR